MDNAETEFLVLMYSRQRKESIPLTNAFIFICTNLSYGYVVFKGLKNSEKEERVFFDDLYFFWGEWDIHDPAVHERRKIDEIL